MPIQKIRFRQSGGFAGLMRGVDVPASELSSTELRALEHFATGPARIPAHSPNGRDMFNYELELDTDHGPVRLEFDESNVPDQLSDLISSLAKRSGPKSP
jgi:hypothetical protein